MRQRLHSSPEIPDPNNPVSITNDDNITLHVDAASFEFHIDAPEDHSPDRLSRVLAQARRWGLEPLDPDSEDEAALLEAGMIRIQLTPLVPGPAWLAPFADRVDALLVGHGNEVKP